MEGPTSSAPWRRFAAGGAWLLVAASAALGQLPGGATRLQVNAVECRNLSQGTTVRSTATDTEWDCAALGLLVQPADRVSVSVRGRVPSEGLLHRGLEGSSVAPLFVESEISDRGNDEADAADFDLDGDQDLILEDEFRWLEFVTDDPPTFVDHDLVGPEVNALGVVALDVNGDGRPDVAASFGVDANVLQGYQNVPGDPPSFLPRPVFHEVGWTPWNLGAADLDGDGDQDLLSWNDQIQGPLERLVWHENDGGGGFAANVIHEVQTLPSGAVIRFDAGDLDGDGDLDVVASVDDVELLWLENDGEPDPSWLYHLVDGEFDGSTVDLAAFDRDGDLDVSAGLSSVSSAGFLELRLYENVDGGFSKVESHTLGSFDTGLTAVTADLNEDGYPDLFLPASSGSATGFHWLENRGDLAFLEHFALNVDELVPEGRPLAVDLGGGGDLDLVGPKDVIGEDPTVRVETRMTVGGWVVGFTPDRVRCRNITAGRTVFDPDPTGSAVDCEVLGLGVSPGDQVLVTVRGVVD